MKNRYIVKIYDKKEDVDFSAVSEAKINNFRWRSGYEPEAYGKLVFVKNDGFYVKMAAKEKDPLARYRGKNVPVCCDSALEFFVSFDNTTPKYINIETNANAAVLAQLGTCRADRVDVSDVYDAETVREGDFWCIYTKVSVEQIEEMFGISRDIFVPGYNFFANFYKCGDETDAPHYGMWNPVDTDIPDFHRPEQFGEMILEAAE